MGVVYVKMNLKMNVLLDKFIADRSLYCSSDTVNDYRNKLKIFCDYCICIDEQNIKNYILYLRNKGIKNVSVRSYLRDLSVFLKWLYCQKYIDIDLSNLIVYPRDDSSVKIPLTSSDVKKIDSAIKGNTLLGLRDYCIIHLMLDCGLRVSEVCNLKLSDVKMEKRYIDFKGKGSKVRVVPLPDRLCSLFQKYNDTVLSDDYVFKSKDNKPITKNAVECVVYRLVKSAGVDFYPHLLRHTFATSFLCGGGDIEILRLLLGHSDIKVTQRYLHIVTVIKVLNCDIYKLDPVFFNFGRVY